MSRIRWLMACILLLTAVLTGIWVWALRRDAEPAPLVGPPRSDYQLFDFDLIALDPDGKESFTASGPRLARHPHLGTMEIDDPHFTAPDASGGAWTSRAAHAWVNAEGTELRLLGQVELNGPDTDTPVQLRSEALTLFPQQRQVSSDLPVTITQPGSILHTTGLRGDLDTRNLELLSKVRIQHEPTPP